MQAVRCGVRSLAVVNVLGSWADDEISVDRGADEHAFSKPAGELKNRVTDVIARRMVKQHILAAAGRDMESLLAHHVV